MRTEVNALKADRAGLLATVATQNATIAQMQRVLADAHVEKNGLAQQVVPLAEQVAAHPGKVPRVAQTKDMLLEENRLLRLENRMLRDENASLKADKTLAGK